MKVKVEVEFTIDGLNRDHDDILAAIEDQVIDFADSTCDALALQQVDVDEITYSVKQVHYNRFKEG